MSKVINIRGTNGSGKTTIVKKVLAAFGGQPIYNEKGKIKGYVCPDVHGQPLYILGAYETPTGGCDGINKQDTICDLIREFAEKGNVLYEGLLISGLFSRYNDLADTMPGHHHIIGFLDTPLEKCIAQTLSRREARAAAKGQAAAPFDPYKTLAPKFEAILSSRRKFERASGPECECHKVKPCTSIKKDVRTIPHTLGFETIVNWLGE